MCNPTGIIVNTCNPTGVIVWCQDGGEWEELKSHTWYNETDL